MPEKNSKKSILVVDDHPIVVNGLRYALEGLDVDIHFDVKESVGAAKQAIETGCNYDLIITDLYLPGESGFEFISYLNERENISDVVVFSATEDSKDIRRAIQLGALSVISKTLSADELCKAVATIFDGEVYNSAWLLSKLSEPSTDEKVLSMGLSARQIQVLNLIDQGLTNKEIARKIHLSDSTIKYHVKTLFLALGVSTRTACVNKARQEQLID